MKQKLLAFLFLLYSVSSSAITRADCQIIDGEMKAPFDGQDLQSLPIEKKSLIPLDRRYPNLHAVEKLYSGLAQTCTNCTQKHIACSD